MAHIMIDLETFGNQPGSVLRSLGAVVFDPLTGSLGAEFYINIDRADSERLGMVVDPETEAWWARQSEAARAALEIDPRPLTEALEAFTVFFKENRGYQVWGQGKDYDPVLLAAAYRAAALRTPWDYNATRDTRTAYEISGVRPDRLRVSLHNALEDAKAQAADVAKSFARVATLGGEQGAESARHLPAEIRALELDRLREEVWAWRQDAAARIWGMKASIKGSLTLGEEDRATDIMVNFLRPSAQALASYIEGDFHQACEDCGKPLLHGQAVWPVEDANDVHVSCWPGPIVQDGVEVQSFIYSDHWTPAGVKAIAVEALAFCDHEEEEDPAAHASGARTCRICGCTDDHACETPTGPCYWVTKFVCSNPRCMRQVTPTWFGKILDQLFGRRRYVVIELGGMFTACHLNQVETSDRIVRQDLTPWRAVTLAREFNEFGEPPAKGDGQ